MSLIRISLLGLVSAMLTIPLAGHAATANVTVENFDFNPSTSSINVNDSVKWTWGSGFHSTTSSSSIWDSMAQNTPFTFTFQFTNSGDFSYFCTIHGQMVGSVHVASANQPPSITITNPVNGATFAAPWTGTIQASASDSDGSVTNVEFFRDSTSLGSVTTAPYNLTVTNVPAGNYTLKAVATDNGGATNVIFSPVTISVVTPVDIVLSDPQALSASQFKFIYTANTGLTYAVERAASLSAFSGLSTNLAASSSVTFTDTTASASQNFYRVRRLPNP